MPRISRRIALKSIGVAAAATTVAPSRSWGTMANDEIQLGFISCGGRAQNLMKFFSQIEGVKIAGLCDPDNERLAKAKSLYPEAQAWPDLRSLIDSPSIDATVIATCNHWHCLAAIWSMQAGKDVYVEKPLSHYPWEGRQTVAAARKYGRVCQVGTHQRSDPLQAAIQDVLHGSKQLGNILSVRCNRLGERASIGRRDQPLQITGVDEQLWFGPAQIQPIHRNQLQYDWHWDWNTGSGEMGNWGAHIIDDVCHNVFLDKVPFPKRVMAGGARLEWGDAGETPNVHLAMYDTGAIPVVLALSNLPQPEGNPDSPLYPGPSSGYVVYCEGGRLEGQRAKAAAFDNDGKLFWETSTKGGNHHHQQNFIDAVRQQDASLLNAEVALGHQSGMWCNMANIAHRIADASWMDTMDQQAGNELWREAVASIERLVPTDLAAEKTGFRFSAMLDFDADSERFHGSKADAANALMRREDRKPFVIPEVA